MSDSEEMEQGGTAVKALAAAAATGAATYAVRKALATRNGHDNQDADEHEGDDVSAKGKTSDDQAESESEDSDYNEGEDENDPAGSAEDEDAEEEESDEDDAGESALEDSAEEEDEYEDDDPDESNGSARGSLRQLVNPARLANLSHLLVPLAGEAADSAGRYVAEHTSDVVQQQVVSRFINSFEKAS